jgi:hypothetical protein
VFGAVPQYPAIYSPRNLKQTALVPVSERSNK